MIKEILIVKNVSEEGHGLIEVLILEQNIPYKMIDLSKEEKFPPLENYSALILLGGPDSANDDTAKMKTELSKVKEAIELDMPILGICLGMQVLVKAAGGNVVESPIVEAGFRDPENNFFSVKLTESGIDDILFSGLADIFEVFHVHGETVELTKEFQLLATGKFCRNQIVKIGSKAYGIQCHLELTKEMFDVWINKIPYLLRLDKEELINDFEFLYEEYTKNGRRLFQNFLDMVN